ncbi:TrbI/VirB10 family protein [Terricaulis silvestris]|uniref:Type IV secretion system protein virB10 n=1 Tax=Terricaulis silvestris TaxID=2686094 RepID=A0A6I6MJV7_9CAUL|nr:TrbI/VirB10 family protein [Terricaulis silvestris]QGZ94959.1 Type IV secretion system protein virB10 [Terricaulis silvestris]
MTTATQASAQTPPQLALRSKPPSPKRLSRKVLLAGALLAGTVIVFALVYGLSERPDRRAAQEEAAVAAAGGPPESIRGASDQYGANDLVMPAGYEDGLFASEETPGLTAPQDAVWGGGAPEAGQHVASGRAEPDPQTVARASAILFTQDGAAASEVDADARLNARLTPPGSRYEIKAGDVIPAALLTALNSDAPGRVIAQVTAPVYDTVSGQHLLIPQGARLLGTYDNGVTYGDRRLVLVWNRLILPNGWSINLREMNASDPTGAAGLRDRTDHHLDRLGIAIGLSAIISVIANEAEDEDEQGTLAQSVGDAAAQQAAQTGARIVDRELTVRPTLRARAGAPVRVLVTRDVELRPYRAR